MNKSEFPVTSLPTRSTSCPECGGRDLEPLHDSATDDVVRQCCDMDLLRCVGCGYIVGASQERLGARNETQRHGKLVDELVCCHWCGYCLRGLRVGDRCPECGVRIEPPARLRAITRAKAHRRSLIRELMISTVAVTGLVFVFRFGGWQVGLLALAILLGVLLVIDIWRAWRSG
jgi:hypothetical protein